MNFDNDMKSVWNSDSGEREDKEPVMPANLDKLKTARMPVEKMRNVMKGEAIVQVAMVIIFAYLPAYFSFNPIFRLMFYSLYTVYTVIFMYFMVKFLVFYRRLNTISLNSKDNLYALYYDIRLNIEMYKSLTYVSTPFAIIFAAMVLFEAKGFKLDQFLHSGIFVDPLTIFLSIAGTLFAVFLTIAATEYSLGLYYGRYAKEVKVVLDELVAD